MARMTFSRNGRPLYTGVWDLSDAEHFGRACAAAWEKIKSDQMAKETSIGAVMEHLHDDVIDQLNGIQINLEPQ